MVIIVAVPYPNGSVYLTRGAMFTYYEFAHPMSDRLTDQAWWDIIDSGEIPEMPEWERNLIGRVLTPANKCSGYEIVTITIRNRD